MTEQYSQTVDVTVSKRAKATQYIGIAAIIISFGFILASAFYNWFLMFGFAAFFVMGAIEMHIYNATAKEYIYNFSPKRVVVAKKDVVNRTRRTLSVLFKDVENFSPLQGMSDDGDIICCDSVGEDGVYELTFKLDGKYARLLFKPDEYMTELIKNALAADENGEEKE